MAFGKKNVVKIDPLEYNIGLIGIGGVGKTTVIYEMCEKLVGGDGYLFAECGREDGADAISGINYVNCPDWNSGYDDFNNAVGFKTLIDDIIEHKDTDYPNLKVLVVDTYDQLREIVDKEVIRLHNKQHPDKRVTSIKAAFGGYMAGEDMADNMILDNLWELKKVGVHFIIIGHVQQRNIVDPVTNETYSQLTTDMSMRSFNKIKTKLHFLGVAYISREIVKEKKGNKELSSIKSEARRITFRNDDYSLDSKSRFADIVDEIPMDSDALIKALTDAIAAEAGNGVGGVDAAKKASEERSKEEEKRAKEYSKTAKAKREEEELESHRDEWLANVKEKFSSADEEKKAKVREIMANSKFKKLDDPNLPILVLKEVYELLG